MAVLVVKVIKNRKKKRGKP